MHRSIKTLAVLFWLNFLLSLPYNTVPATPEYYSSFRDYNLTPPLALQSNTETELSYIAPPLTLGANYSNTYAWGNCTAFVASKVKVPNSLGNANTWAVRASAQGYAVSATPAIGAVGVDESGGYGHVVLVSNVIPPMVEVHEANVYGLGIEDVHWYDVTQFVYVYF